MIDETMVQAQGDKEIYFLLKEGYITRNKLLGLRYEILNKAEERGLDMSKFEGLFEVIV